MFKLNPKYGLLFLALLVIEILIAKVFTDSFIRPFLGDFLVVILIYCFVKSLLNISIKRAALGTLVFAYTIETLQYFNLVQVLGLEDNKLARIVIGSTFDWWDMLAYTLAYFAIIWIEKKRNKIPLFY